MGHKESNQTNKIILANNEILPGLSSPQNITTKYCMFNEAVA